MSNQRMEDNLSQGLHELARETSIRPARPEVREALLAELRRQRPARRRPLDRGAQLRWWQAAAAAVVLIGLGFGFAHWTRKSPPATVVLLPPPPAVTQPSAAAVAPAPDAVNAAVSTAESPVSGAGIVRPAARKASRQTAALRPERWSDTGAVRAVTPWFYNTGLPAATNGQVLRLEVTAATAARFGVAASGPVQAEIFIADDGLTRAIRFVQ